MWRAPLPHFPRREGRIRFAESSHDVRSTAPTRVGRVPVDELLRADHGAIAEGELRIWNSRVRCSRCRRDSGISSLSGNTNGAGGRQGGDEAKRGTREPPRPCGGYHGRTSVSRASGCVKISQTYEMIVQRSYL